MARTKKTVANGGATAAAGEVKTSKSSHGTSTPKGKNVMPDPNGSLKETPEVTNESVRRSGRNKKSILSPSRSQVKSPVVKRVNHDQNKKGGESKLPEEKDMEVETRVETVSSFPQPEVQELSLEEKVDHLIRTVEEFKPKVFGTADEGSSLDYKSLYIDTKKKYEDLMEDHYELIRKLEYANGQIAAFEKMKGGLFSSSPQMVPDGVPSAPVVDDNPNPMKRSRKKKIDKDFI